MSDAHLHRTTLDVDLYVPDHALPFPVWIAQKYGKEGYQFSDDYVIHHAESAND